MGLWKIGQTLILMKEKSIGTVVGVTGGVQSGFVKHIKI